MGAKFKYDVFLSYSDADRDEVRRIAEKFTVAGLQPFLAVHDLGNKVGHSDWDKEILTALEDSDNLAVFCSQTAAASKWVEREVQHFDTVRKKRPDSPNGHMILAIRDPRLDKAAQDQAIAKIEPLRGLLYPESVDDAVERVAKCSIDRLRVALQETEAQLEQARDLAWTSFTYYRHARFWKPFAEAPGEGLHIFTCGRDTPPAPEHRGAGGRTNIDIWDYQAAVDITHYFARNHRDTKIQIEQPMRKSGMDQGAHIGQIYKYITRLNHNCVVIGSPDVSDFAEVALGEILDVPPYAPDPEFTAVFRIRKAGQRFSTFYRALRSGEQGGIELWDGSFYPATDDTDYGVLVLADNPFSDTPAKHKILILAGHSGVATRSLSLLLTSEDDWCLKAFYKLDQDLAKISGPIAAVIKVRYRRKLRPRPVPTSRATLGRGAVEDDQAGDDREIESTEGGIEVCRVIDLGGLSGVRPIDRKTPDVISLPTDSSCVP